MPRPEARPAGVGAILDEGLGILASGFVRFAVFQSILYAVPTIALALGTHALAPRLFTAIGEGSGLGRAGLVAIVALIAGVLAMEVLTASISLAVVSRGVESVRLGRSFRLRTMLEEARRFGPRVSALAGSLFVAWVAGIGVPSALIGSAVTSAIVAIGAGGLAVLVAFGAALFLALRFGFAPIALAVEGLEMGSVLARSMDLMRGRYGRGLALLVILAGIAWLLVLLLTMLVPLPPLEVFDPERIAPMIPALVRAQVWSLVLGQAALALAGLYGAICWTLFYLSLRKESGGAD